MACNLVCCAVAKYLFINGLDFLTDAKIAIVCAIHSLRFIEIYVVFGFWWWILSILIHRLTLVSSRMQSKALQPGREVTCLRKFFNGRHVPFSWHLWGLFKVHCLSIRWKSNLNATTTPRTQFTFPLTGHSCIECRLLASLRCGTGFTSNRAFRLVLIDFHRGARVLAHLFLINALARRSICARVLGIERR